MRPLRIQHADHPLCFKNHRSLLCTYRVNKKALMTQAIFWKQLALIDSEIKKAKRSATYDRRCWPMLSSKNEKKNCRKLAGFGFQSEV
ncbi:hypothetical protein HZS_7979 [Henneguya salminicola]|nr:hypothetical protein HZS_7979 [Henneguya salminicola]